MALPRCDTWPHAVKTPIRTGHSLGATGVQEAIYCLLMLQKGFIAGSANVEVPDVAVGDLPLVTATRDAPLRQVLSNSFGFNPRLAAFQAIPIMPLRDAGASALKHV